MMVDVRAGVGSVCLILEVDFRLGRTAERLLI